VFLSTATKQLAAAECRSMLLLRWPIILPEWISERRRGTIPFERGAAYRSEGGAVKRWQLSSRSFASSLRWKNASPRYVFKDEMLLRVMFILSWGFFFLHRCFEDSSSCQVYLRRQIDQFDVLIDLGGFAFFEDAHDRSTVWGHPENVGFSMKTQFYLSN